MTRKRFIKLVMSQGFQRNKANRMAYIIKYTGIPYELFWEYASGSPVYVLNLFSYMGNKERRIYEYY